MLRTLGRVFVVLSVCFAVAPASAQATTGWSPAAALLPPQLRHAFSVESGTLQSLLLPPILGDEPIAIDLRLGDRAVTLDLAPFDVRSPSFQLWERTAAGLAQVIAPPCDTWRGAIAGEPDSAVAATVAGGTLRAWLRRGDGSVWVVQPLADAVATAPATAHVVYRARDVVPVAGRCGVAAAPVPVGPAGGGDSVYVCDLALEADYPLWQWNGGSTAATQNDVLGIVNAVDVIFRTDVQIQFVVTQMVVDTAPDPYTTSHASSLLAQFQGQWNTTLASVPRDVAHLFSGRSIGAASGGTIGYAYVGAVCSPAFAYGVSETHWTTNFALRVGITAHEIGHNFNATHCDGQPACGLMCSMIGGCASNPGGFGSAEQAQILAFRQQASCLVVQSNPPAVASLAPTQVPTVDPHLVTVYGTGFAGTTSVTVGGQVVTSGIQVVSDTVMRFTPPFGLQLGVQPVTVTNAIGTSNPAPLTYVASNPCMLVVPAVCYSGAPLTWRMGGWPNDAGLLGFGWFNATVPWLGLPLLDGFVPLWAGGLDARGIATFSVPVPQGLLTGFTVWTQLIDVIPATTSVRSVSPLRSTWFLW